MWGKVDQATKDRFQAEYQINKIQAAKAKEDYEAQHGKIKPKKRNHKKDQDKKK